MTQGKRDIRVSGPLVVCIRGCRGKADIKTFAGSGDLGLISEIIEMRRDEASIQVHERKRLELVRREPVSNNRRYSVEVGPELDLSDIDGIQRALWNVSKKLLPAVILVRGGYHQVPNQIRTTMGLRTKCSRRNWVVAGRYPLALLHRSKRDQYGWNTSIMGCPLDVSGRVAKLAAGSYTEKSRL